MDCYLGNDDFVLLRDDEHLDRLLSQDRWSQLGISTAECFIPSNKYIVKATNSAEEELSFNMDIDSSICGGLMENSAQWRLAHEWPYHQLDDLVGVDQMDDIFLCSLFEEDLMLTKKHHESSTCSPESQYRVIPTVGSEKEEVATLRLNCFNLSEEDNSPGEVHVEQFSVDSEEDSINGQRGDETSLEQSILREFEMVITQLTENTRFCIRDALYRLAENSKQYTANQRQDGDLISEKPNSVAIHDDTSRLGKAKSKSEANTIDRAIANLMFNRMNENARNLGVAGAAPFKLEAAGRGPLSYSFDGPLIPHCSRLATLARDCEVPIFGLKNPYTELSNSASNML